MLSKKFAAAGFALIVGCGLVTLFAALKFAAVDPAEGGGIPAGNGGYIMLAVDAAYSDRAVREALSSAGIDGSISESGSWVFLDDFGGLKRVALDRYEDAVESFDPRNDGYAEKLRSFFVKDGKRRFFIDLGIFPGFSLAPDALTYSQLERQIGEALGAETAFTLDAFVSAWRSARRGPEFPLLCLFLAVLGGALILALKSPGTGPRFFFRLIIALVPVQLALALFGPGGFACAAALFGCFECLLPPLRENMICLRRRGRRFKFNRIFMMNWLSALLFFLVYIAVSLAAPIHPLPAALAGATAFAAFVFFLWTESNWEREPRRYFFPVPIRQPPFTLASLPRMTLPFALASFFSLFLPLLGPSAVNPDVLLPVLDIPSKEEYEAHFAFQSSFSLRPLGGRSGEPGREDGASYLNYFLGGDGLIADSREIANPAATEYPELPPFPLEGLRVFLENGGNRADNGNGAGETGAAVMILLLAFLACFAQGRERRRTGSLFILSDKGDKAAA